MHRTIVVGRGLIGSAAARHLSAAHDGVCLIGPSEPPDRATHQGVFASHYDEGRMTRVCDADEVWALTAARSIARYRDIEAASGIEFYTNTGYLGLGDVTSEAMLHSESQGRALGADVERLDEGAIRAGFRFLEVPANAIGLHERSTAGHISPRSMVAAQTEAARRQGAVIVDQQVSAIRRVPAGVEVETADGELHHAERVLVATGAFTDACALVPIHLDLRVFGRTVVLARTDDAVLADLADMPTMGHSGTGAYILPPIRYPDGRAYVKIGIGRPTDHRLVGLDSFATWFKGPGSEANRREFRAFITDLIPPLAACTEWHTDTCAVAQTVTGRPHIDFVDDGHIAVAVGGNGKGAKSSDDWGLAAATLVTGGPWDHPVPRDALALPTAEGV